MLIFWMLLLSIVESIPRLFKMVKNPPAMQKIGSIPWLGRSPWRRAWKQSSILAWRIPWTEEPGGLQSMGLHRVGHN